MKKLFTVVLAIAFALSVAGLAVAADNPAKAPAKAAAPAAAPAPEKKAEKAAKPKSHDLTGTIEALNAADGTFTVKGKKGNVDLKAGDKVKLGDFKVSQLLLEHLDDTTVAAMRTTLGSAADASTQTLYIPASSMISRTTNGAASGSTETATNKIMIKTLDFDTTTQEFAQFSVRMPKGWDEGTVTAAFTWSHAATTTNFGVVWQLQGVALSDNTAIDTAFGTAQTATDTGGTTDRVYISPTTAAITIGNTPIAEDWVVFQVARVPANGSDTMAIDALLHGVTIYYTTTSLNDA